jgi:SAM-dependent methyltransferase
MELGKKHRIKHFIVRYEDLNKLVFGDQHWGTQQFFIDRYGLCHTIPLEKFPHYIFLRDNLEEPYTNHIYAQYLKNSWDYKFGEKITNDGRIIKKIEDFISFYRYLEKQKIVENKTTIEEPISITVRPDGKFIIGDGNHRASIALKLGLDIRVRCIHPKDYLQKIAYTPYAHHGSVRLQILYQSIFDGEVELIRGRRPDILKRFKMIKKEDLVDRSILDLGCNLGANIFLATRFGAQSAIGVDNSHCIITAAIRLNSYFALPCKFIVHDLNTELPQVEPVDTVFCFSIDQQVKNKTQLVETILEKTKRTFYFEGSAETNQEDYRYLLNDNYFSSIKLLGYLQDAIDSPKLSRPFFRCEVARDSP